MTDLLKAHEALYDAIYGEDEFGEARDWYEDEDGPTTKTAETVDDFKANGWAVIKTAPALHGLTVYRLRRNRSYIDLVDAGDFRLVHVS